MQCRICGHRANSIKSMGEHYRKKHPKIMAHHKKWKKGEYGEHGRTGEGKWIKEFANLLEEYGSDITKWSKRY